MASQINGIKITNLRPWRVITPEIVADIVADIAIVFVGEAMAFIPSAQWYVGLGNWHIRFHPNQEGRFQGCSADGF